MLLLKSLKYRYLSIMWADSDRSVMSASCWKIFFWSLIPFIMCWIWYMLHICTLDVLCAIYDTYFILAHWVIRCNTEHRQLRAQTTVCALILITYLCTIYTVTPIWIGDMDPILTGRIVVTIGDLARRKRGRGPVRGRGLGSGSLSTSRPIGCGWTAVN